MIKVLFRITLLFFALNFYGQEISWNYNENYQNSGNKIFSTSLSDIVSIINQNKSSFNLPIPVTPKTTKIFNFKKSNVLKPELANSNNIEIYRGISEDDKIKVYINFIDNNRLYITIINETIKITLNNSLDPNIFVQNIKIEPESNKFLKFDDENCGIDSQEEKKKNSTAYNLDPVGETPNLIKYRIAVIPSSEWSNYFINEYNAQDLDNSKKRSIVLGEIGVTLAEINSIYERDLGVTFELIENNEFLIEFDTTKDGITHSNKGKQLSESINILNNVIGFNNYDIGHVFDAANYGGVAYIRALCGGLKAGGVSGSGTPNDNFFMHVVAHEIGHQFGAFHTFNSNVGSGTNRVEPGAGTTIMGYREAGEYNQYFHAKSIKEMTNHMRNSTCGVLAENFSNQSPKYKIQPKRLNYTIPTGTPFMLGYGIEIQDDNNEETQLLYSWEQMDGEKTLSPPVNTSVVGPMFRSLFPNNQIIRSFPNIETVADGEIQTTWEVIPQLSRQMNFTFTVRDDNDGGGSVMQEDYVISAEFSDDGAFSVLSQKVEDLKYNQDEYMEVIWNHLAAKNSVLMNIDLSLDGGFTFPINLISNTPNDGVENVKVPNFVKTKTARVRVMPTDNIFYNINSADFEIIDPKLKLNLVYPKPIQCFGDTASIIIDPVGGAGGPYKIIWEKNIDNIWTEIDDTDNDPKTLINIINGNYRVTLDDKENNQIVSEIISVIGPLSKPEVNLQNDNKLELSCFGEDDGYQSIKASGGVSPYTVLVDNQVVQNNINANEDFKIYNLSAGVYSIKIIDNNGCVSEANEIKIIQPEASLDLSSFNIVNSSSNDGNGSITIEISGGTSNYIYEWTNPTLNFSSKEKNIENLKSGIYYLKVTDSKGCFFEKSFEVEDVGDFNYNLSITNVLCYGELTGEIITNPTGGQEPYSILYYDSNNKLISNDSKASNLKSGTYKLIITDSDGENFPEKSIEIIEPEQSLNIALISKNNIICFGEENADFEITVSGGVAPYQYKINNELVLSNSGDINKNQDNFKRSKLKAGIYEIEITDSNNCSNIFEVIIESPSSEVQVINAEIFNVTKYGLNDGSISMEVLGGTLKNNSDYIFSWSGPENYSSNEKSIKNLKPGIYKVLISDDNNCSIEKIFEIKSPQIFNFNSIVTSNPICYDGNDGTITIEYSGGYGQPYIVNWYQKDSNNNFSTITSSSSTKNKLEGIKSGVYRVEVLDSYGSSYFYENDIIIETIDEFKIELPYLIKPESCAGQSDGSFSIKISGGTAPYSYYFDEKIVASERGNITTNSDDFGLDNLERNVYTFYAIDKNGCVSNIVNINITGNQPITITNEPIAAFDISCFGAKDGSISPAFVGGDGSGVFTYSWNGPNNFKSDNKNISDLVYPGKYSLTVSQGECYEQFDFEINEPKDFSASIDNVRNYNCTMNQGQYTLNLSGGTPPYYVNGVQYGKPGVYSYSIPYGSVGRGIYNYELKDSNECKIINLQQEILAPESTVNIETSLTNDCNSKENNTIDILISGGSPFQNPDDVNDIYYLVNIYGPNGFDNDYEIEPNKIFKLESLTFGDYRITVFERDYFESSDTSKIGCETSKSVTISETLNYSAKNISNVLCVTDSLKSKDGEAIFTNIIGGTPFMTANQLSYYKYRLIDESDKVILSGEVNQQSDIEINGLAVGNYKIEIYDKNNCLISDNFNIDSPAELDFTINEVIPSCNNPELSSSKGEVNFKVLYGKAPYEIYIIDSNQNITFTGLKGGNSDDENTVGYTDNLTGLDVGDYYLKVVDNNGCESISERFSVDELEQFKVKDVLKFDIECFGEQSGKIIIGNIEGGNPPYNIVLQSNNFYYDKLVTQESSNFIIDNLPSNSYNLTIQDADNKCGTYYQEFDISEPYEIKVAFTEKKNQSCYDSPDGNVSIDIEGGSLSDVPVEYKISWFKDNILLDEYKDNLRINNLEHGFYQVNVSAISMVNGIEVMCVKNESFQIDRPDGLYASEVLEKHVDVDCHAGSNGQFEVYFIGGVAPYSLSVNGAILAENIFDNIYQITDLKGGEYVVDIIDANGCSFSESSNSITGEMNSELVIKIEQPQKVIDVDVLSRNVSCYNATDGIVELNVSGGKSPYKVNWFSETEYKIIEADEINGYFKISTGSAEIYASVTDATNYCGSAEAVIKIDQPTDLTITEVNKLNNVCYGEEEGEIEIFVSGNKSIYSHEIKWFKYENDEWRNIESFNNINISDNYLKATNLPNGKYQVLVDRSHLRNFEDGEEIICSNSFSFDISSEKNFKAEEDKDKHQDFNCEFGEGYVVISITDGIAPYKLTINNDIVNDYTISDDDGDITINNLQLGEHIIIIEDFSGCIQTVSTEIVDLDPLFDIDYERVDSNLNGISEGYSPNCYNGLGSFEFRVLNNKSSKPLKFYLNEIELEIGKDILYLQDSFYVNEIRLGKNQIKVIDDIGACRLIDLEILNSEKIRFKEPDLNYYIEKTISCADQQYNSELNSGIIDITNGLIGGNPFDDDNKYIYKWTGPNFSSYETRVTVNEPGLYNLQITDSLNCISEIFTFDMSVSEINSNTEVINLGCDTTTGSLIAAPSGGNGPYQIEWFNSNKNGDIFDKIESGYRLDNLNIGYYISKVTDFNGCNKTELHYLIDEKVFTISEPTITQSLCLMEPGAVEIKIYNPYDTKIEFLYNNEILISSIIDDTESYIRYKVVIDNPVEFENLIVQNNFGCSYEYLLNLGIGVPDFNLIYKDLTLDDFDKIPFRNNKITIQNNSGGKYHSVGYDLGDGSEEIIQLRDSQSSIDHSYKEEGYYIIIQKLYNRQGCFKEIKKTILIGKGYTFEVPNAFTPNNDGINDYFRPIITGLTKGEFYVYDNNGNILYSEDFDINKNLKQNILLNGWDGYNRMNKNKVYYFKFIGYTLDESEIYESGYFSIIE